LDNDKGFFGRRLRRSEVDNVGRHNDERDLCSGRIMRSEGGPYKRKDLYSLYDCSRKSCSERATGQYGIAENRRECGMYLQNIRLLSFTSDYVSNVPA
jgi:hypothetical protein